MIDRLFVYGTLRKDVTESMHHLLTSDAKFVGYARVKGRLFDLGEYPGLVTTSQNTDEWVKGEIYALNINDDLLMRLDFYEGCSSTQASPHEFERAEVAAVLTDGTTVRAWTYVYRMTVEGKREITSGDYAEFKGGALPPP